MRSSRLHPPWPCTSPWKALVRSTLIPSSNMSFATLTNASSYPTSANNVCYIALCRNLSTLELVVEVATANKAVNTELVNTTITTQFKLLKITGDTFPESVVAKMLVEPYVSRGPVLPFNMLGYLSMANQKC